MYQIYISFVQCSEAHPGRYVSRSSLRKTNFVHVKNLLTKRSSICHAGKRALSSGEKVSHDHDPLKGNLRAASTYFEWPDDPLRRMHAMQHTSPTLSHTAAPKRYRTLNAHEQIAETNSAVPLIENLATPMH
jgi:hypothetical protein